MRRWFVKVHDLSACKEIFSHFVNKVNPVNMQMLRVKSVHESLPHHRVRDPLSLVEVSEAGPAHRYLEIFPYKLTSTSKWMMGPHPQHLLRFEVVNDIRISQFSVIPGFSNIRTGNEVDPKSILPIPPEDMIDWTYLNPYLQRYIFQFIQRLIDSLIQDTISQQNNFIDLIRQQLDLFSFQSGIQFFNI